MSVRHLHLKARGLRHARRTPAEKHISLSRQEKINKELFRNLAERKAMIPRLLKNVLGHLRSIGEAIFFLGDIISLILRGRVRWNDVLNQMYEQGVQSIMIVMLTSLATGTVLGLQGFITLQRFGAKEFIARLVALSLLAGVESGFYIA
jgi:ABC-type transporter Mla maintaining outer membrane lipid asymmetry permease subunit MlaE